MKNEEKTLLIFLEKETKQSAKILQEACDVVRDQEISNYPIIFAATQFIEIGIPIPQMYSKTEWIYRMTTLEELVTKQLINMDKVDNFRVLYKQRKDHLCVFAVYEGNTQLIFVSMKSDVNEK
ncbi:MAG: hypothetical protein GY810_20105 [Aureispira sp.]|nr:hypothetical protein [Aureispira sp.]